MIGQKKQLLAALRGVVWGVLGLWVMEICGLMHTLLPFLPTMAQREPPVLHEQRPHWVTPQPEREPRKNWWSVSQARAEAPGRLGDSVPLALLGELCAPVLWASHDREMRGAGAQDEWMTDKWEEWLPLFGPYHGQGIECQRIVRETLEADLRRMSARERDELRDARKALEQAVVTTGLAGLHVRLGDQRNAVALRLLERKLLEYNRLLEEATGWKGPVLGLNGRVVLSPYALAQGNTIGQAWMDKEGLIHVAAGTAAMAHEWFHAVDFVMGSAMNRPVRGLPLSAQMRRWDVSHKHPLPTLWNALRMPPLSPQERQDIAREARENKPWISFGEMQMPVAEAIERNDPAWNDPPGSPWMAWMQSEGWLALTGTRTKVPWWIERTPAVLPGWMTRGQAWRSWHPGELLAEAFEAQFHGLGNALDGGEVSIPSLIPMRSERMVQRQLFRDFFNQAPEHLGRAGETWAP